MKVHHERLDELMVAVFSRAGCADIEAKQVADHLVKANLAGHDSHGVIRAPIYVRWVREEKVIPNQRIEVVFENDVMALVDGRMGFGQAVAFQALELGLEKTRRFGVSIVALRNAAHVGRVGHWAEIAAAAGKVSLHFVNTTGLGMLVAPIGGIGRRLSANPIAVGIPRGDGPPIIFDISTSSIAEGKLKVAFNKGVDVPPGCMIDADGIPTNDPRKFYAEPPGALLPFGGHKGYGLGLVTEILAGALTGGGCTQPGKSRLEQGMLTIIIDPARLVERNEFFDEIRRYVDFVRSAEKASPDAEILMPGEMEARNDAERRAAGIELDEKTWSQITETARSLDVQQQLIDAAVL